LINSVSIKGALLQEKSQHLWHFIAFCLHHKQAKLKITHITLKSHCGYKIHKTNLMPYRSKYYVIDYTTTTTIAVTDKFTNITTQKAHTLQLWPNGRDESRQTFAEALVDVNRGGWHGQQQLQHQ